MFLRRYHVSMTGMISLGGGLPHPDTFPFKSLSVELKDGSSMEIKDEEMKRALQYSPTVSL
jgi:kynurenine/2-aminoadipate aminotransferase